MNREYITRRTRFADAGHLTRRLFFSVCRWSVFASWALFVTFLLMPAPLPLLPAHADVTFTPQVNLSSDSTHSQEPEIAAAGSAVYVFWRDAASPYSRIIWRRSMDGGTSWIPELSSPALPFGEPRAYTVRVAATGTNLYVLTFSPAWGATAGPGFYFRRSLDRGATFDAPLLLANIGDPQQAELLVSGQTIYVLFTGSSVFLRRSVDGGATWDPPLDQAPRLIPQSSNNGVVPKLRFAGNTVVVAWQTGGATTKIARSWDGGVTFESPLTLSDSSAVDIAVSGTHVYTTWAGSNAQGSHIHFARSAGVGAPWEPSVTLSVNTDNALPTIRTSGPDIYVVWNDRSLCSSCGALASFRRSSDGGQTWDPALEEPPRTALAGVSGVGQILLNASPAGLFLLTSGAQGVLFASSHDRGLTWSGQTLWPGAGGAGKRQAVGQSHVHAVWSAYWSGALSTNLDVIIRTARLAVPPPSNAERGNATEPFQAKSNDPVNTATGNYVFQQTDLSMPDRGLPFVFQRTYNSQDTDVGPLGPGWTHSYNILLIEDPDGSVRLKHEDGHEDFFDRSDGAYASRLAWIRDTLVKNADGSFTLTQRNQTTLRFTPTGQPSRITDRNGNSVTLSYVASELAAITNSAGRAVSLTYDSNHRLTALTDFTGRRVLYAYDTDGRLSSVTDPAGGVTQFAYDSSGLLARIVDARGNVLVDQTYDAQGRVATQTNGRGFTTTFAYDTPAVRETTLTDPLGHATIHGYDLQRRLVKVVDAAGRVTTYTYDDSNNRTGITDPAGRQTAFTYDLNGNVTSIRDPLGNTTTFTYDAQNNRMSTTNATGATTTYAYDSRGNLTSLSDAAGHTTIFSYDARGQLIAKTDALGNMTRYQYDKQGNLKRLTDALNGSTRFEYDRIGRLTATTDPNGHTSRVSYDAKNQVIRVANPLRHSTRFTYDAVGSRTVIIDAKGQQTRYAYDAANNLTQVTDALGNVTEYTYDAANNRITTTDANGHTTTYVYDALNRLASITDPLGNTTTYTYDVAGNVATVRDANGTTNTFSCDANNRLLGIAYGDGASVSYTYDPNGNRASMLDQRGTTSYAYDAQDRVVEVRQPDGSVIAYGYDAVGNRTALTYPDGRTLTYTYDGPNRLAKVRDLEGLETTYTYDRAGNLIRTSYPNGTSIRHAYDPANRLVTVENMSGLRVFERFAYTLDPVGNRLQVRRNTRELTVYTYDALSQLIGFANSKGARVTYTYDPAGNRLSTRDGGISTQFAYDAGNRLLQMGNTVFSYDANGNRITRHDGVLTQYAYDSANRLAGVIRGGQTVAYAYDGDGNKIGAALGADTTTFTYDSARALPVVLTETRSASKVIYAYGLGLVWQKSPITEAFYHYDGLGSVASLTDNLGNTVAAYAYDPWGVQQAASGSLAPLNRFRFTGEELDEFTDVYYLRARWYDPSIGRFLTPDPAQGLARLPLSSNRYIYALNNVTRLTDPTGHFAAEKEPQLSYSTASILDQLGGAAVKLWAALGKLPGWVADLLPGIAAGRAVKQLSDTVPVKVKDVDDYYSGANQYERELVDVALDLAGYPGRHWNDADLSQSDKEKALPWVLHGAGLGNASGFGARRVIQALDSYNPY